MLDLHQTLTDDVSSRLEGQLYNTLILIRGSEMEHRENVLPPWSNIPSLRVDHLGYTADHHVPNGGRSVDREAACD